jgi:hypothetical protein
MGLGAFVNMTDKKMARIRRLKDTIKCECEEEILILPDVSATSEAIEVHIALHMKGFKGPVCKTTDAERLRDSLIMQVLRIVGGSEDKETNE